MALYLAKQKMYNLSGLACFVSLTLRQTNIVWSAFIASTSLLEILQCPELLQSVNGVGQFIALLTKFIMKSLSNMSLIIRKLWTFILLAIGFVVFIKWNGGITLGDRANHTATVHTPQLWYFSAFTCFFSLFSLGGPIQIMKRAVSVVRKRWLTFSLLLPIICYSIAKHT